MMIVGNNLGAIKEFLFQHLPSGQVCLCLELAVSTLTRPKKSFQKRVCERQTLAHQVKASSRHPVQTLGHRAKSTL